MKKPKSTGAGTTGSWELFVDAYNKIGEDEAKKRRDDFEDKKINGKTKKKSDSKKGETKKKRS
jgi:hypothetical protein